MSDAGNDGQRELSAVGSQFVIVKAIEIRRGAATTYDDDHVEEFGVNVDALEGGNNAGGSPFALHHSREEVCIEHVALFVPFELMFKIAEPGSSGRGNDGDALWQRRHRQRSVHIEHPLLSESPDRFLSLTSHVSQGESRVHIVDQQREAVLFVEVHLTSEQHLHAYRKRLSCLLTEKGLEHGIGIAPAHCLRLCHYSVSVLLDEFEIGMSVRILLEFADLRPHPYRRRERLLDGLSDTTVQLIQRNRFHKAVQ